ncbi:MAG: hypothetical protein A2V83_11525, partial [Nitrospirae bacterium RBG_16_64_22]
MKKMLLLGGTGFIGREVVRVAQEAGWHVGALSRSDVGDVLLRGLGATPVRGDAAEPWGWVEEARGAAVMIDLVQPPLPARLGRAEIRAVSRLRQVVTRRWLEALAGLPPAEQPRLLSVSGVDDLEPDGEGRVSHRSALRARPVGFGHIGIPVRRLVEASGFGATYVHLGTVYGPGKGFADHLLPALAERKQPIMGSGANRLPLVHVSDAAMALVHLAGLDAAVVVGRTFVVSDGAGTTQRELFENAAGLLGAKPPRRIPRWLASLIAGRILVEVMARDVDVDPSALMESGFALRFPTHREGMAATVRELGDLLRKSPRHAKQL